MVCANVIAFEKMFNQCCSRVDVVLFSIKIDFFAERIGSMMFIVQVYRICSRMYIPRDIS